MNIFLERLRVKMPDEIGREIKELEGELLGMLLLKEGQVIPEIQTMLTPDDFYYPEYQVIYKAIVELYNRKTPPNLITIIEELKATKQMSERMLESVIEIGETAFSNVYAEGHAKKIKEYATRRKIFEFSVKLNRKASDPSSDLKEILKLANKAVSEISTESAAKGMTKAEFTVNHFEKQRESIQKYFNRKTGFTNIDEKQIFSPGLYVLGATPACGKTTFVWQLMEQMAGNGETCIFCSYEMSMLELFTKSYAREMYKRDPSTNMTAADIRKGAQSPLFNEVFREAADERNSVQLFELRDENVDDLLRILRPHCKSRGKSPVVCVDYLQIIPPSSDVKLTTDKARIDDIVHKLKTFQRETNTTFIVISSFNRVNYYQQVSFESFKESGNIEYTADVVWALQMYVANTVKDGANISSIRKKFEDAKLQKPRELQLKCLKNRQGNNYDCYFNYYSAHDYFKEATLTEFESNHKVEESDGGEKIESALSKAKQRKLDRMFS